MSSFLTVQVCPRCGRVAPFSHPETTVVVCICGTVLNRKEGGVVLEKSFPKLTESYGLIQIGTTGMWQQKPFTVLGRFRVWLKEAVVNYWTIALDNGNLCYLVEGYGLYAIHEKLPPEKYLLNPDLEAIRIGQTRQLKNGDTYLLEKKDECGKWEVEGELWLPECRDEFSILDFSSEKGGSLELISFLKNYVTSYQVTYTSFADLQLDKLQTAPVPLKEVRCENCWKPISIMAYPHSHSLSCPHCKTHHVLALSGKYVLQALRNEIDAQPDLQVGASGRLKDIDYTVIGATVKQEIASEPARWQEYTLYNRQEGYAFLSEYNGHWIYVRQQGNTPVLVRETEHDIVYGNEPFKLFNYYSFRVLYAAGEFPNNLFNDSEKIVREFISPPEMWIWEKSPSEGIEWFLGQHTTGKELQEAFGDKIQLPYTSGIGMVQPTGFINPGKMVLVTFVALLALIAVHLITTLGKRQQTVLESHFDFRDTAAFTAVAGPIKLAKSNSNIEVNMTAPVDNSWAEMELSLVNTQTGEEFGMNQGIEYYHGYSDGESWTEGSTDGTAYFSHVPAGVYTVQVSGMRDAVYNSYNGPQSMSLQLIYDVPDHRNLIICMCLLIIWPIVHYFILAGREKTRWQNSPLTPYTHES
jgi:ribosomal protein S27E